MCIVTLEFNQSNALARRKLAALLATGLFVEKDFKPEAPRTGASPSRSPVSSSVKSLLAISSATSSVASAASSSSTLMRLLTRLWSQYSNIIKELGKSGYYIMMKVQHIKKMVLVCLLGVCCVQVSAQDVNAWLQEQLNASADLRHVDYDEMYDKALQKGKGVDPLIRSLVVIDYCRAYGLDSLAIEMADFLLEKASNEQMERGIAAYLLDMKYRLALLQNQYDEIQRMASYIDCRWRSNPKLMERARRWHRLAEEGKNVAPVRIVRSKDIVSLAFDRDSVGHVCIDANVNKTEGQRFIIDTGMMSSTILFRKYVRQMGVRLLPDSIRASSATYPDAVYSMQLGIIDSLRIGGIKFCNLPVWVSDEAEEYDCVGFIGTPDLVRLEYMELSRDSIVFRYPLPKKKGDANFTMNPGARGERCICLPCTIDGHKSSFVFDTGSNSFLLPRQYTERTKGFFAEVGGMQMWLEAGMYTHRFVPHTDSRGFWGLPLLWSFERLCFNFRDMHVDYVKKKDVKFTEYTY